MVDPRFVPPPFIELMTNAGNENATIPHLQSDHLPIYLYETKVTVGDTTISLVLPESEDAIVDVYSALGRPNDDPHWATLWQGSVALAEQILENPELVKDKRVIDLGTGLGLAGIAAAIAGASEVVLTDREPKALYCVLCAAAANGLEVISPEPGSLSQPYSDDGVPLPELLRFQERNKGESSNSSKESSKVSVNVLDWFAPDFSQFGADGFDVVLACDVLYTPEAVDVIAPLVMNLFNMVDVDTKKKNEKRFVLADPPGRFPENHVRFLKLMEDPSLGLSDSLSDSSNSENGRVVRVDAGTLRDCVNLEGEVMTVELSTYRITNGEG